MLNEVVLMGRFTRDPELRSTNGGVVVTSFSLAVERDKANSDGTRDVDFIDIVAWRQLAEFVCKYFGKGQLAAVRGRLQRRTWKDKDGANRATIEVVASDVYFADSKGKASGALPEAVFTDVDEEDGDLPF